MKVITMCGSLKFEEDIKFHHRRLALEGNCVLGLTPTVPNMPPETPEQIRQFGAEHYKKIDLADAVFVVNKGGYIGESVKKEIEYAKTQGKEILFLEDCKAR